MTKIDDPILRTIIRELKEKYTCHTVILYGSRARGNISSTSDYDVIGICKNGTMTRIAKKQAGFYWDVFVYPEKDLRKLGDQHFGWKQAKILHSKGRYGINLLRRIETHVKKPYKNQPQSEINVIKIWAQKELDRCRMSDIQALYRRVEFQSALIEHYFFIRQKRFWGPKDGFIWIKEHDPKTFNLIHKALKNPSNLSYLKAAASKVYKIKLI